MNIDKSFDEYLDYLDGNDATPKHLQLTRFKLGVLSRWCANTEHISDILEINAFTGSHWKVYWQKARKQGKTAQGQPYSSHYIHGMCRTYRAYINWLYEMRLVKESIPFKMPILRKPTLLRTSPALLEQAVEACETERDRLLLLFVYDTGARRAEITRLTWGDVNLKTGVVKIKGKGETIRHPKMGKSLRVHMRRARFEALERCEDEETLSTEPVFVTRLGFGFTEDGVSTLFARLAKKMGKKISAHSLRRGSAKVVFKKTNNIHLMMVQYGWSSHSMVQNYVGELTADDMAEMDIPSPVDDLGQKASKMVGHGAARVIHGNQRTRNKNQQIAERKNGREVQPLSAKGARKK